MTFELLVIKRSCIVLHFEWFVLLADKSCGIQAVSKANRGHK